MYCDILVSRRKTPLYSATMPATYNFQQIFVNECFWDDLFLLVQCNYLHVILLKAGLSLNVPSILRIDCILSNREYNTVRFDGIAY
jgi:hypothetical protein